MLCPVGWGCRIHRLYLCRGVRPPPNECSGYVTKQSDGKIPVMLGLRGMRSNPSYIQGLLNKFRYFFRMGTFIDSTHWNSSPLRSDLLRLQRACCTVPTTSERPHGNPLLWACKWPSSRLLSSPQLSHNDSLWAYGITKSHREQSLDYRDGEELSWCPSWSNSLWQGWSCGLVHYPGGNATDPIWRVQASSDGISSWTPLKPQHNNPNPLSNQLWCIDFLTPPTPLIILHRLPAFLESLMPLKNWCSIHARCSKIWNIPYVSMEFLPSLKQIF